MSCPEQTNIIISPGPQGEAGIDGTNGTNGQNAYTTVSSSFPMSAELGTVSVSVGNTDWMSVGQVLFVQTAGHMKVSSITDATTVVLINLENTATSAYPDNAAPTTTIASGSKVSAAGLQGPTGVVSGSAGGDLSGTYPNPTVAINSLKGDLSTHNGTVNAALGAGPDNQILHADSSETLGLIYRAVDLGGTNTSITGQVPVANGGTGAATAVAGFDALSPMTTRGDLILGGTSGSRTRLPIGPNGTVLASNGTTASYQTITSLVSMAGFSFVEDTSIVDGSSISIPAPTNGMGTIWAYNSAVPVTASGLKLPDASSYVNNSTGKFFVLLQLGAGGVVIQSTDAAGNPVNNNTGTASAWQGVVYLPMVYSGGTEWFRIQTIP